MRHPHFRSLLCFWLVAALGHLPAGWVRLSSAHEEQAQVELVCKIRSKSGIRTSRFWRVELHHASGEIIHRELKVAGEQIRFRNLKPDIYILSISDGNGRERSESIDLNPPPGQSHYQFKREIEIPGLSPAQGNRHQVSARRLSVPQSARDSLAKSDDARLRGDSQESMKHLKRALEIDPGYPDALNNMGVYYKRNGDIPASMSYFRRSVDSDPDYYPAWINLGGCLLNLGNFEEALSANRKAQLLRPADPVANSQLALTYYYLHKYRDASEYFKAVVRLDPLNAAAPQLFLAHIAIRNKNALDAENYIRDFMKLHPNSSQAAQLERSLLTLRAEGSAIPQTTATETGP